MTEIKSISVSSEFSILAKQHNLSWTEAARIGMGILLAEAEIKPYDNELNLYRKMQLYQKQASEAMQKIAELEEKNEKRN
jgi:hypothetical protein